MKKTKYNGECYTLSEVRNQYWIERDKYYIKKILMLIEI